MPRDKGPGFSANLLWTAAKLFCTSAKLFGTAANFPCMGAGFLRTRATLSCTAPGKVCTRAKDSCTAARKRGSRAAEFGGDATTIFGRGFIGEKPEPRIATRPRAWQGNNPPGQSHQKPTRSFRPKRRRASGRSAVEKPLTLFFGRRRCGAGERLPFRLRPREEK